MRRYENDRAEIGLGCHVGEEFASETPQLHL